MIRPRRTATAAGLALGATLVGVLGLALPASAHVTVNPKEATQGGYGRVDFRVPNESDTASTTKVEVNLPENAPIASVSTIPVPGWTVVVEKRKVDPPLEVHGSKVTEAAAKITWTATAGGEVKPGQFQEFGVSMGPLPASTDKLIFKVLQTYSDGNISRWIDEPAAAGAEEPEHPAPVLKLNPAAASAAATPGASVAAVAQTEDDDDSEEGSGAALGLGIAGLVAGLAGLALGGLAFARTRRPEGTPAA